MKELKDFTVGEFYKYKEVVSKPERNIEELLELFDINIKDKSAIELESILSTINAMSIIPSFVSDEYKINGKKYKLFKSVHKMTASQFIDYQVYAKENKMDEILSIFLIPIESKGLFRKKVMKYGEGYNIQELQKDIREHMKIEDAIAITDFFLTLFLQLLRTTERFLIKKKETEKTKITK